MSTGGANVGTLAQAWGAPEVKRRLMFVFWALVIFVLGTHIPAPGIDALKVKQFFDSTGGGGLLGFVDIFTGGGLQRFSILALGIMPYINASIMMQLLVAVEPRLKEIQQEGDEGRKRISKITRWLAVGLAFFQGAGLMIPIYGGLSKMLNLEAITALFAVVGGTCFLMWLADEITQKGVGNGASIIIMIGIVARIPVLVLQEFQAGLQATDRMLALLILLILCIAIVAGIVFIQLSVRRVPIQYARRQIGKRVYGGQSTFLPIKIAQAGVIPIIFAVSVLMIVPTFLQFMPPSLDATVALQKFWTAFSVRHWYLYTLFEFALVFLFTFVYTAVSFNTQDIADNLKKNNGFVPGVRPGKPTFEFLDRVLHRITFFGGCFLGLIAILPGLVKLLVTGLTGETLTSLYLGGTSLLIVVGVALDTVQQMQAHLVMRHYSGFNK